MCCSLWKHLEFPQADEISASVSCHTSHSIFAFLYVISHSGYERYCNLHRVELVSIQIFNPEMLTHARGCPMKSDILLQHIFPSRTYTSIFSLLCSCGKTEDLSRAKGVNSIAFEKAAWRTEGTWNLLEPQGKLLAIQMSLHLYREQSRWGIWFCWCSVNAILSRWSHPGLLATPGICNPCSFQEFWPGTELGEVI